MHKMHAFRRMPDMSDNADAVCAISMGLVGNDIAMFVLQHLMVHVVCL